MAAQTEKDAIKKVDQHVSPKECFVWYANSKIGYEPIPGTGCAEIGSRTQKGWDSGKESSNGCRLKFLFRVKDIVKKAGGEVDVADVKAGNVWVNDKQDHCGIVCNVVSEQKHPAKSPNPTIEIQHCSSRQGKVATNDWATYFKGGGKFYKGSIIRLAGVSSSRRAQERIEPIQATSP